MTSSLEVEGKEWSTRGSDPPAIQPVPTSRECWCPLLPEPSRWEELLLDPADDALLLELFVATRPESSFTVNCCSPRELPGASDMAPVISVLPKLAEAS